MKNLKRLSVVIAMLMAGLMFTGCDIIFGDEFAPKKVSVKVILQNQSSSEVHMFISGENFDQSNKLFTGETRTKTVKMDHDDKGNTIDTPVEIFVGQNGVLLAVSELIIAADDYTEKYTVSYRGGSLFIDYE